MDVTVGQGWKRNDRGGAIRTRRDACGAAPREWPDVTRVPGPVGSPWPAAGRVGSGHSEATAGHPGPRPETPRVAERRPYRHLRRGGSTHATPRCAVTDVEWAESVDFSRGSPHPRCRGPASHPLRFTRRNRHNRPNRHLSMRADNFPGGGLAPAETIHADDPGAAGTPASLRAAAR